ncbi:hypothetical protein C8Q70DRAFT_257366 [Cubamyces menziesii]|nr:hypothetical protein C8Q70DRAFT_257366 [Cubamyces menziesii]
MTIVRPRAMTGTVSTEPVLHCPRCLARERSRSPHCPSSAAYASGRYSCLRQWAAISVSTAQGGKLKALDARVELGSFSS